MATRKKASVIVYDLKNESKLAKAFILKYALEHTYKPRCKGIYKLILLNSKEANNSKYYEHIKEFEGLDYHNPLELKQRIEEAEPSERNANWFEALDLAVCALDSFDKIKGIEVYQVIFLTQFSQVTFSPDNIREINRLSKDLNDNDAYVYFVGLDVPIEKALCSYQDIYAWTESFTRQSAPTENIELLQKVVMQLDNVVVCNELIAQHLVYSFKSNKLSTQTWRVPLKMGRNMGVKSQVTVSCRNENPVKLRQVNRPEILYVDAEDSTKTFPYPAHKGFLKHGKFVEMADKKLRIVEGERSFYVLGFTDRKNAPSYLTKGESSYVLLNGDAKLLHLIRITSEQNLVIIARRVYNRNFNPKIVSLTPDVQNERFVLQTLPYLDNLPNKTYNFTENDEEVKFGKDETQTDFVDSYINSKNFRFQLSPAMAQELGPQRILVKAGEKLMPGVNFADLLEDVIFRN